MLNRYRYTVFLKMFKCFVQSNTTLYVKTDHSSIKYFDILMLSVHLCVCVRCTGMSINVVTENNDILYDFNCHSYPYIVVCGLLATALSQKSTSIECDGR